MGRVPETVLFEKLAAIYEEVTTLHSGSSCEGSSDCCQPGKIGREPFVTSIEAAFLSRAVLANDTRQSAAIRKKLPLAGVAPEIKTCALLDSAGRCTQYEARPLGCRTFYCERATHDYGAPDRRSIRDAITRIESLALEHTPRGDEPRGLSSVLSSLA